MRTLTHVVVAMLLMGGSASLQGPRPQDVEMQAAIRTETVDGNLEKAIEQYTVITKTYRDDRRAVATALVRLAGCYQKRGDGQARAIYQRIVTEFSDQKEAVALARERLGSGETSAGAEVIYKRVWPEPADDEDGTSGTISPDGRYLSYVNWTGGDLMLRDMSNGTSRRLTGNGKWPQSNEYAEQSAISRDGNFVAYSWFNGKDRYQLRIGDLRSSSLEPRTVLDDSEVVWVAPHDWSPDGKLVAVTVTRRNRKSELAIVPVTGGPFRTLRVTDWNGPSRACFSPDSRFLAYDVAVGANPDEERDLVVVGLSDGREVVVASNPGLDRAAAWSPDGSRLVFTSDRSGSLGLWSQPMENGAPTRMSPALLKTDIGAKVLGTTSRGSLYTAQQIAGRNIYIAEVDFKTGTVLKPAERAVDRYVGMNEWPDWSRDGRFLSYVYARNWVGRSPTIAIRSLENGQVREIPITVINGRNPLWAPDGQSFISNGVAADGRVGIFRLDARDGTPTPLIVAKGTEFYSHPELSPDGRKVYVTLFPGGGSGDRSIVEYDIESGFMRDVIRKPGVMAGAVSPDGKSIATIQRLASASTVLVASLVNPEEPREVIRVNHPQVLTGGVSWAPDGSGLMVNTFWNDGEKRQTWLVPLSGGSHKVLDLPGYTWGRIRVHPDGKRVAYHAGNLKYDVWVLENFLK